MAKYTSYTTPRGVARYPYLNAPDDKPINGKPQEPSYKVDLVLSKKDAAKFIKLIQKHTDEIYNETIENVKPAVAKKLEKFYPFFPEEDEDGTETGNIVFRFKQKASVTSKTGQTYKMKVGLFDAAGKPTKARIGGGSEIKVSCELVPFYMAANKEAGITLRLGAVQVLELVEWGEKSASAYGFEEEDGFVDEGEYEDDEETSNEEDENDELADDEEGEDEDIF